MGRQGACQANALMLLYQITITKQNIDKQAQWQNDYTEAVDIVLFHKTLIVQS